MGRHLIPVMPTQIGAFLGALFLSSIPSFAAADPSLVTFKGAGAIVGETPVVAELKISLAPGNYRLRPRNPAPPLYAQVFSDQGKLYLATILKPSHAESDPTYSLEAQPDLTSQPVGIEFRPSGSNLDVFINGKLFTTYRTDEPTKPYFWPLIGPTNVGFTRAYPLKPDVEGEDHDHPHHRSLWFTHGKVNGVDFWASDPNNKPGSNFGTIQESSRTIVASGPAVGILRTTDNWIGPDDKVVCEDERVVRFYNTANTRILDFDIALKAVNGPILLGDTKEGTFGLRLASSMDVTKKTGGRITNAEGVNDDQTWGKASSWVDYTGPLQGKTVGVAILNHPNSFRYPTTWHVRTYGLFAANPFGWRDFGLKESGDHILPANQILHFRYRLILHEGDTHSARIPNAFRNYATPPTLVLEKG